MFLHESKGKNLMICLIVSLFLSLALYIPIRFSDSPTAALLEPQTHRQTAEKIEKKSVFVLHGEISIEIRRYS